MALRQANANEIAATATVDTDVAFEPQVETVVEAPVEVQKEASTAIATAQRSAVAAPRKFSGALCDLQNVIPVEDVEALGVGAFPRVTVDLGGFMLDKEEIGTEIKVELISWNFRHMVTTGSNDEEAKKKVKISYDGETCTSGESVNDALAAFKEEGYEGAEKKLYVDLFASLVSRKGAEIPEEDRPLVQVQLSPESVKKFGAFRVDLGYKQAKGLVSATPIITLRSQRGEWKGNRYGFCTFALK